MPPPPLTQSANSLRFSCTMNQPCPVQTILTRQLTLPSQKPNLSSVSQAHGLPAGGSRPSLPVLPLPRRLRVSSRSAAPAQRAQRMGLSAGDEAMMPAQVTSTLMSVSATMSSGSEGIVWEVE